VTTLTVLSAAEPATAGRRATAPRGRELIPRVDAERRSPLCFSLSPSLTLLLSVYSRSRSPSAISAHRRQPPRSPSEPGDWSTITPSSCSSNFTLEPLVDDAERTHFLSHRLPPASPLSTAVHCQSLTPPRPQEGLQEHPDRHGYSFTVDVHLSAPPSSSSLPLSQNKSYE
jgi:hypothetical protein